VTVRLAQIQEGRYFSKCPVFETPIIPASQAAAIRYAQNGGFD